MLIYKYYDYIDIHLFDLDIKNVRNSADFSWNIVQFSRLLESLKYKPFNVQMWTNCATDEY